MTKARKIELLYKRAKGLNNGATDAENRELKKYKVSFNEPSALVTKANIAAYIDAVDKGAVTGFYDWCLNNCRADRRFKGSDEKSMKQDNRANSFSAGYLGFLPWAFCLYYVSNQRLPVIGCLIAGAIIAFFLVKLNRRLVMLTCFLGPIIVAVVFGKMYGM